MNGDGAGKGLRPGCGAFLGAPGGVASALEPAEGRTPYAGLITGGAAVAAALACL